MTGMPLSMLLSVTLPDRALTDEFLTVTLYMLDLLKDPEGLAQVTSLSLIAYGSVRAGNVSLTNSYESVYPSYKSACTS